jgi:acyl-CoA thioester hydrolase
MFERSYEVIWADLDANAHMRHTAYMDYAAQARVGWLHEMGFSIERLAALGVGPILFREETRYLREVRGGDRIRVGLELIGLSSNRKHWRFRQPIYRGSARADADVAAVVEVQGAWLDLRARKVAPPPAELLAAIEAWPRAAGYAEFEPQKG